MKVLKTLIEVSNKQDITSALATLPAPAVLRIAKILNVKTKGNKFSRMQEIFDNNTLTRIISVYNTYVLTVNGNRQRLQDALNVGKDVIDEIMPVVNLLIENKGKVNIQELLDLISKKTGVTMPNIPAKKGLEDYQAQLAKAKELGFTGRGSKIALKEFFKTKA